jgi:C-terminal processing protease CtpA/Prc
MRSAAMRQPANALLRPAPVAAPDHGVSRVRRLRGRAGYFEITFFECGAAARRAVSSAIRQLGDATAIILDLRRHRGGEESMASYVTSCLFATEPMARERFAPSPLPPGAVPASPAPRLLAAAIDVLVSRETSSLGRAFAANLERMGRARIVGPAPKRWAPARVPGTPSQRRD